MLRGDSEMAALVLFGCACGLQGAAHSSAAVAFAGLFTMALFARSLGPLRLSHPTLVMRIALRVCADFVAKVFACSVAE
jgi:hypothetical protein